MDKIIWLFFWVLPARLFGQLIEVGEDKWNALLQDIKTDSIVCLGEERHWVETYLDVKKDLIKLLYEKKNFDVVIFESGFVNSFTSYIDDLDSDTKLRETLYDLWQTKSTRNLINYFDSTQNSTLPVIQLGCDIKGPVSFRFSRYINRLFCQLDNSKYGQKLHIIDSTFVETRRLWEPEIGKAFRGKYLSDTDFHNYKKPI